MNTSSREGNISFFAIFNGPSPSQHLRCFFIAYHDYPEAAMKPRQRGAPYPFLRPGMQDALIDDFFSRRRQSGFELIRLALPLDGRRLAQSRLLRCGGRAPCAAFITASYNMARYLRAITLCRQRLRHTQEGEIPGTTRASGHLRLSAPLRATPSPGRPGGWRDAIFRRRRNSVGHAAHAGR